MRNLCMLAICCFLFAKTLIAQKDIHVQILTGGTNTSLRGMSIASNDVIWVSGSNGTIGKSVDAGKSWRWMTVPGFEKRDFRDIEAFDSSTAIAMAVDTPGNIIKTTDGGATWRKVFERSMQGMFLDAMDFKNEKEGICIGDPLPVGENNKRVFYIIRTYDGGETWKEIPINQMPEAQRGEAIFAASGTNISFFDDPDIEYGFVSGGMVANVYKAGRSGNITKNAVPIVQGKESTGAFSMATDGKKNMYCIGGNYKTPDKLENNFSFSTNAGVKWSAPASGPPSGYHSCIRIILGKTLVACGTQGVDFATNGQKEWKKASTESFNVCMVSKAKQVFFAGAKGKIGKLVY